jgi:UDP-N-acetylglucosamine:LPS N-acetylglucosamine transferase
MYYRYSDKQLYKKDIFKKEIDFKYDKPIIITSFDSSYISEEKEIEIINLLEDKQCILICKNEDVKSKIKVLIGKNDKVKEFIDKKVIDIVIKKSKFQKKEEKECCLLIAEEKTTVKIEAQLEDLLKIIDILKLKESVTKTKKTIVEEIIELIKNIADDQHNWQKRLFGKRKMVLLRLGKTGGHFETIKAIEEILKKRLNLDNWEIENIDTENFFGKWALEITQRFIPWSSNLPIPDSLARFFISLNNRCSVEEVDLIIPCAPAVKKITNYLKKKDLKIPCLPIVSDFGNYVGTWLNTKEPLYLLGTNRLLSEAEELNFPNVIPISGMVIRKQFKDICQITKAEAKKKLGFGPNEPVVSVCYGSRGYYKILHLAEMLKDKNVIFICGTYKELKEKLEKLGNKKHKILGYVDAATMATCLRASEVMIGKPGPGVVSETWECECVPVCKGGNVVMLQEKSVEQEIIQNQLGIIVSKFDDIPAVVDEILSNPIYKKNCSEVKNHALEQVCELIEDVAENLEEWSDRLWGK